MSGSHTLELSQPIQYLKGVGPKRGELFSKLGIATVKDALYYFPYRYEDRGNIKKIARVSYGSYETVTGVVVSAENVTTPRRRMKIFELTVKDETGSVTGIWFNQPYMSRVFQEGARVILYGLVKQDQYKHYRPVMENPEYEIDRGGRAERRRSAAAGGAGDETVHTGRVVPIYKATAGLSVRQIRSIIKNVVDEYAPKLAEFLAGEMLVKYKIPALPIAVKEAHFPSAETDVALLNAKGTRAQKRLIFDEFLLLELGLLAMKKGRTQVSGRVLKGDGVLRREFRERLPFKLTDAQENAVREISRDMERPVRMNRLLQGDVGCGKTVVAMMAVLTGGGGRGAVRAHGADGDTRRTALFKREEVVNATWAACRAPDQFVKEKRKGKRAEGTVRRKGRARRGYPFAHTGRGGFRRPGAGNRGRAAPLRRHAEGRIIRQSRWRRGQWGWQCGSGAM